jgi:hypothetical protein
VVEWHAAGKDWRTLATHAGYAAEDAARYVARYTSAQALYAAGATVAQVAGELDLPVAVAADYLAIMTEERYTAARRARKA